MRKAVIWLFAGALLIRAFVALLQMHEGINSSFNLDSYLYGTFNPGFELFHDFYYYYVGWLANLSRGLMPYSGFSYQYPPLFLYTLYPFYLAGGAHAASIPIIAADAATAPVIYLIARRFANDRISLIAGISYAVSPFFVIYEGYLWFSAQPMTFFMTLSIYLILRKRPLLAALLFAVALLYRQELIFLAPMYFIWYLKTYPKSILWKATIIVSLIIGIVSIPFIILSPYGYLSSMSYGVLSHSNASAQLSALTNTAQQVAQVSSSPTLSCTTLDSTWRSLTCNYGNFSYSDMKTTPPWTAIFSSGFMDQVGIFFFFPLFGLVLFNAIRLWRKESAILLLFGSILVAFSVAIFSVEVHQIYRYYLIPCYVMLLMSSRTIRSMCIAITLPIFTLILPSGSVQLVFPLIGALIILFLNQEKDFSSTVKKPSTLKVWQRLRLRSVGSNEAPQKS